MEASATLDAAQAAEPAEVEEADIAPAEQAATEPAPTKQAVLAPAPAPTEEAAAALVTTSSSSSAGGCLVKVLPVASASPPSTATTVEQVADNITAQRKLLRSELLVPIACVRARGQSTSCFDIRLDVSQAWRECHVINVTPKSSAICVIIMTRSMHLVLVPTSSLPIGVRRGVSSYTKLAARAAQQRAGLTWTQWDSTDFVSILVRTKPALFITAGPLAGYLCNASMAKLICEHARYRRAGVSKRWEMLLRRDHVDCSATPRVCGDVQCWEVNADGGACTRLTGDRKISKIGIMAEMCRTAVLQMCGNYYVRARSAKPFVGLLMEEARKASDTGALDARRWLVGHPTAAVVAQSATFLLCDRQQEQAKGDPNWTTIRVCVCGTSAVDGTYFAHRNPEANASTNRCKCG